MSEPDYAAIAGMLTGENAALRERIAELEVQLVETQDLYRRTWQSCLRLKNQLAEAQAWTPVFPCILDLSDGLEIHIDARGYVQVFGSQDGGFQLPDNLRLCQRQPAQEEE
jgi:hypothetical protein